MKKNFFLTIEEFCPIKLFSLVPHAETVNVYARDYSKRILPTVAIFENKIGRRIDCNSNP
jgi:hypothetical protein